MIVLLTETIVTPADKEQAFEEGSIDAFIYTHKPLKPWSTLREMFQREVGVLVLAENIDHVRIGT